MAKYHVTVVVTQERIYEVEAEDAASARRWITENAPPEPLSEIDRVAEIEDVWKAE